MNNEWKGKHIHCLGDFGKQATPAECIQKHVLRSGGEEGGYRAGERKRERETDPVPGRAASRFQRLMHAGEAPAG